MAIGRKIAPPAYDKEPRAVTLVLRVKHEGKWRRFPAAYGGNGRVKPGHAHVDGLVVAFEKPASEIRTYEGRQARYLKAGRDATNAEAERKRLELQTTALAVAENAGLKVEEIEERKTLRGLADNYYKDAEDRQALEAEAQARQTMEEFIRVVRRDYVDEVTRQDILRFHAALRKRGCQERTVSNKHARLKSVLKFGGVDVKTVMPPEPKYDETLPTIYSPDQLKAIFAVTTGRWRIAFQMALKLGLREQEIVHGEWTDVDWTVSTYRVQSKPEFGFKVKDSEERDIPIPADFLDELKAWRDAQPEKQRRGLIVPTSGGVPDGKLLHTLKTRARQAGQNCNRCDGCRERKECAEWTLHRFRRSFVATLLRRGVDVRTVQHLAGHADLETTMRYLRPAEGEEVQAKINAVQWF